MFVSSSPTHVFEMRALFFNETPLITVIIDVNKAVIDAVFDSY